MTEKLGVNEKEPAFGQKTQTHNTIQLKSHKEDSKGRPKKLKTSMQIKVV